MKLVAGLLCLLCLCAASQNSFGQPKGVNKNEWNALLKKAKAGDAETQGLVAFALQKDDPRDSVYWYMKACDNNDMASLEIYGAELIQPKELKGFVSKDPQKGLALLEKASKLGSKRADFYLGVHYGFGKDGVEQDSEKALLHLKRAKAGGFPGSTEALAKLEAEIKAKETGVTP